MDHLADLPARSTRRVRVAWTPDPWPGTRLRLGLIAIATDHATERELRRMLPAEAAELYVNRVSVVNPCTLYNLRAMETDLARAAAQLLPGTALQALAFACTSGTVAIGAERVIGALTATRPGVPCTTPITAVQAALAELGVRQVSMLTPYIDEVNEAIREYLEAHGIGVPVLDSFGLSDDLAMSSIPPDAILEAALQADHPQAEAIFICCTAFRAVGVVEALERHLGKPVIASNQAMLWHALRLAGYRDPVPGFGRLLRHPGAG